MKVLGSFKSLTSKPRLLQVDIEMKKSFLGLLRQVSKAPSGILLTYLPDLSL
jgi:hypothetical protein